MLGTLPGVMPLPSYFPTGQEQIAYDQSIICMSCTKITLPLPGPVQKMGIQREMDTTPAFKEFLVLQKIQKFKKLIPL